ncbi:MAG: hypothetical protein NT096_11420, partial [Proteobacteria bacterium]|nr:hypothetical protein [Pseudomonadota bacterium]
PITIDRIIPTVVNITGNKPVATTTSTIQAVFSEEMQKTTVENTSSWTVTSNGTGIAVTVQSVSLASDGKTVTVTTTVMSPSKSYNLNVSPVTTSVPKDLVGNKVVANAYAVTAPGGAITGITITQPSTTPPRIANAGIFTVQVNAASGSTVNVHLINSTIASTGTTYWESGTPTMTEVSSGVYSGTVTVNTTSNGTANVIASTDSFASRVVSTDTITIDNTGPSVSSVTAIGCRNVLVNFNETLRTGSGTGGAYTPAANYFGISPTTGVTSISTAVPRPGNTSVLLTFTGSASRRHCLMNPGQRWPQMRAKPSPSPRATLRPRLLPARL